MHSIFRAGEFIAQKHAQSSAIVVSSVVCPEAPPLTILSEHLSDSTTHLIVRKLTLSRHRGKSSHMLCPSKSGILVFDLLQSFGSASVNSSIYAPTLISLPRESCCPFSCSALAVSEDGTFVAAAEGITIYIITLPELSVSTMHCIRGECHPIVLCCQSVPWEHQCRSRGPVRQLE
jgi:hypothetical protein